MTGGPWTPTLDRVHGPLVHVLSSPYQNAPWSSAAKSMLPGNAKCSMTSLTKTKHIFKERKMYLFMKPRISQLAKTTRG